ncbi:MAG: MFS transporter [Hyphomicrobiaceae bacterium]
MTAQTQKEPIGFIGPLAGTFAVQTIVSLAMFGIPVIAPVAARDIGVDAELVGTFTAIAYATGMVAGLLSGIAASRFGLIRVCQSTMVLVLAGALVLALSSPVAAIASAVLLGLSYGPINPVSTQILASVTTPRARPLVFSVKQTGMPAGAALAGVLLPFMIGLFDWRIAFISVGAAAIVTALLIEGLRSRLDRPEAAAQSARVVGLLEPVRLSLKSPQLRCLMTIGFVYGGSQVAIATFYVIHLTGPLGLSLEVAGLMYTLMQISAVAGRLLWGGIAGWLLPGHTVLAGLGLATSVVAIYAGLMQPSSPLWLIAGVSVLLGLTSHGFNGVMFAESTRHVPENQISSAAGGVQFASLAGVSLVPLAFGLLVTLGGAYVVAYGTIAAMVLTAAAYAALGLGEGRQ